MSQFGPAWQSAEFNAYYYASYWIVPVILAFSSTLIERRWFWTATGLACAASFVLTWYGLEEMWALRESLDVSVVEQAVLERHRSEGKALMIVQSLLRSAMVTSIWTVGALVIRLVRRPEPEVVKDETYYDKPA